MVSKLFLGVREVAKMYWAMGPVILPVMYWAVTSVPVAECLADGGTRHYWDHMAMVLRAVDAVIWYGFFRWFLVVKGSYEK